MSTPLETWLESPIDVVEYWNKETGEHKEIIGQTKLRQAIAVIKKLKEALEKIEQCSCRVGNGEWATMEAHNILKAIDPDSLLRNSNNE